MHQYGVLDGDLHAARGVRPDDDARPGRHDDHLRLQRRRDDGHSAAEVPRRMRLVLGPQRRRRKRMGAGQFRLLRGLPLFCSSDRG